MVEKQKGKGWVKSFRLLIILGVVYLGLVLMTVTQWATINTAISNLIDTNLNVVLILLIVLGAVPLALGLLLFRMYNPKMQHKNIEKIPFLLKFLVFLLLFLQIIFLIAIFYIKDAVESFFPLFKTMAILGSIINACILAVTLFPVLKKGLVSRLEPRGRYVYIIKVFVVYGLLTGLSFYYWFNGSPRMLNYPVPAKPGLFAHRGACNLAPENTIIAAAKALQYNPVGWETDVVLTSDGIPILSHGFNLQHTTNIETIFPDRASDSVDTFTLAEIKQLDAGSWFVDEDPAGTIKSGLVTPTEAASYRNVTIPTLAEALNFTIMHNLMIYLDLKDASGANPYADHYFEIITDTILASGIKLTNVQIEQMSASRYKNLEAKNATDIMCGINLGPLASPLIYYMAPYKADFAFSSQMYSNYALRELNSVGILVHEWTVDDPARFQELWLLGVDWVMTNDIHILSTINDPGEYTTANNYYLLWIGIFAILIAEFILGVYILNKRKNHQEKSD